MNEARFLRYLEGDDSHPGARDATAPPQSTWTNAPLRLSFAGESSRWGGGVCFVDPDPDATAFVRAWDITAEQFEDVFAQENRLDEPPELDWSAIRSGQTVHGDSWYSRIVPVELDFASPEQPALTFTWSRSFALNPPALAYRETIATGLADHPGLSPAALNAYLDESAEALNRSAKQ